MPPVEVAAARLPFTSSATAPTVPIPSSENSVVTLPSKSWSSTESSSSVAPGLALFCLHCSHWPCRNSVFNQSWLTSSTPPFTPKSSAASLLRITGQPCCKIKLAALIGCLSFVTLITEPAALSVPRIIEASMVIEPSSPITEPCPALNKGSSSSISTASVTASRQSISPLANLVPTTLRTCFMQSILPGSSGVLPSHGPSPPAPPWMTKIAMYHCTTVQLIICCGSAGLSPGSFLHLSIEDTTSIPSTTSPNTA